VLELADTEHACSYLHDRQAIMPLVYPLRKITPTELDQYLEHGRRRSGSFLYHTACPHCQACEPTRLRVDQVLWTRSMRRVLIRGDRLLKMVVGAPSLDERRLTLFNLHRSQRRLGPEDAPYGPSDFQGFLIDSCCDTLELSFWREERLVACSIIDVGQVSVSAVYTYFDPAQSALSLGTYAILKQIEWVGQTGRQLVYLGMYVSENQHLRYKARFAPQERYRNGRWEFFARPSSDWSESSGMLP
jgi:arginine-tRNA-protein transferase